MANAQLKEEIVAYSKSIGIDKIGFAAADPFKSLKERLKQQQQLGYQSGFEEPDLEKRTEPELLLSGATTIVSIAIAYPSKLKDSPRSKRGERRGLFCRASWGVDYHHVLREKLSLLESFIKAKVPSAETSSMVDTGELSDRAVAERAGIGFSGKNTMTITEEYGSWVYLGEMITNVFLEPDEPVEEGCGDCNICVDACPTGALIEGGQLNASKCIAFLTQTKGFLPDQYRSKLGNRLYGCDTCQLVCPKNKGIDFHNHPELEPDPEVVKPKLIPLLTMSNRDFKEKFGKAAGSWRGKKPIQRNAILALAHYKDETAVDTLIELMQNDPRPVIRGTSAWALGKIGGSKAYDALINEQMKENDQEAANEIEKGLSMLQNKS
ncbi:tRNA epoxyqueuosine(34) reductase QueG [Alkalihalobacillus sp. R86527]|uniref:tRNA epoxyqueuosine(34) reductase QueG n=1 Tax=Alkalihalobacillus sp. R86527 TaxID=3093863 RepID=UPI003671C0AA